MTTIAEIKAAVAAHYGVTINQLCGKSRARAITFPRQVAMFLARRMTDRSLPEIGRAFGRDHTTVIHALGVVSVRERALSDALVLQEALVGPVVMFRTRRKNG